jgi:hypothetical protein
LREFGRRHALALTVVGTFGTGAALVLDGQQNEFTFASSRVADATLAGAVVLQVMALLARSEARISSIEATTGLDRRRGQHRLGRAQTGLHTIKDRAGHKPTAPTQAKPVKIAKVADPLGDVRGVQRGRERRRFDAHVAEAVLLRMTYPLT